jgi:hypothetical protein
VQLFNEGGPKALAPHVSARYLGPFNARDRRPVVYVVIAIDHPKSEYVNDFLAFMARVEAVAQGSRGMLQFRSWHEENSNRLV